MRPLALVIAVLGLVGIVLAALVARQQFVSGPSANPRLIIGDSPKDVAGPTPPGASPLGNKKNTRPARPVASDLIAVPPIELDVLERIEPRPPLSDVALAAPPEIPERFRVFRPLATAAGRVEASSYIVTIAGVAVVEPDETCARDDGSNWPCGMLARTAFRNFLRGRSIECRTPSGPLKGTISTDCVLGKQDIGNWLTAQGWARAAAEGSYVAAEETAKSRRLGIHGPGPASAP